MEEIEITIVNWEKYNPQDFKTKYPHWFRLNRDTLQSESLFELEPAERWVWIGLLCLACEKKTAVIACKKKWLAHRLGVSVQVLVSAIQKLCTSSSLEVNRELTSSLYPVTRQDKTVQDSTRQNNSSVEANADASRLPVLAVPIGGLLDRLSLNCRDKLNKLYPDVDFVEREVVKMEIWLGANAAKQPRSLAGWSRFVMGWLERGWERYRKTIASSEIPSDKTDWDYVIGKKEGTCS